MPPWKPLPNPIPAITVPTKKPTVEPAGDGHEGGRDAEHQRQHAGQHQRPRHGGAQHHHRQRGRARQHEQAEAAEHDRVRVGQAPHEGGTERGVEARQRPHGEQHGRDHQHRAADAAREPHVGHQRGQRAVGAVDRLAHQQHAHRLQREHREQDEVDQPSRRREVLDDDRRQQRAGGGPDTGCDGVRERAAAATHVEHARTDRAQPGAGRHALHDPCHEQLVDAAGVDEQDQREALAGDRGEQHRPAAEEVGQPSERQQRGQHRDRIHAEHDRRGDRGEAPLRLVGAVQRRRRRGCGQEADDERREQVQRDVRWEAPGGRHEGDQAMGARGEHADSGLSRPFCSILDRQVYSSQVAGVACGEPAHPGSGTGFRFR